ncbi:inosine-uridine nucleoside N-ribohydrolase [Ameyamaea chiangmaiensis NBRC 103196]|uniref:Nucleoside hydrolase n=1 Tax=Ameyamaea chiangmaiensis TaxID=442969 RepID=A0A850PBE3_9PROT|nr:nucleoside hydrolase [Ameyamaea chiangmaiensis]MBS4074226.1 nucleoside hydrolase [Ameyamaea chiangmaiensis]NVN41268.1 nucleoside hydrolase [Ameyamaea chiangmaiensis]GBQ71305.1 inosine-uridine nucleoside N-ribohydrolase [Ameyamaea chiangmaiensis NBRC 103196]
MSFARRRFLSGSAALAGTLLGRTRAHAQAAWTVLGTPVDSVAWLRDVRRVIIDTDPGTDDLLAIMMMLGARTIVTEAVTVTPGNIGYDQEVRNALWLAQTLTDGRVPVYRGIDHPLMNRPYPVAGFIHGRYGFGDMVVPEVALRPGPEHAATAIVRIVSAHPGEVVLLALGGLSNIALALLLDPSIARKARGIVMVGGRYEGIGTPVSFNAMVDPEAADIVLRSGLPIVMTGDLGRTVMLTQADFDHIRGFNTDKSRIFLESNAGRLAFETTKRHKPGATYADPFAASLVLAPAVAQAFEAVHMTVELSGTETRGAYVFGGTHIYTGDALPPNVVVCTRASADMFRDTVFKALQS